MSEAPIHWIKQIENAVLETQKIPLWGSPSPFPWELFEDQLAERWQIPGIKISAKAPAWRNKKELAESLGAHPYLYSFALTPLKGRALLALSAEDALRLGKTALAPNSLTRGFSDRHLREGFFTFLLLHAASIATELNAFHDLSITMEEEAALPEEGAMTIDLHIKADEHHFWARILCTQELHAAFREHFVRKQPSFSLELARSLELPVHLQAGSTSIRLREWQKVKKGDMLLLDRSTFDPITHKGSVDLVLDSTPLFHARLKEEGIKILDYALYNEEEKVLMTSDENNDEEEFFDEESEEFEEDDDDEDEDEEDEDDDDEEEEEEELPELEDQEKSEEKSEKSGDQHRRIAVSEIPLTITVEVARLTMPVEQLLQLKPGNELLLPVHPEQGVHLLISGKRVAKGELIKVGETLGVRILEIGE